MIMRKYFKNKLRAKRVYDYVKKQRHKRIYAEDVIFLNKKNKETERREGEASILTMALAKGEVGKGWEVACRVFPEEILHSYDPKECGMNWEKWNLKMGKDPYEVLEWGEELPLV